MSDAEKLADAMAGIDRLTSQNLRLIEMNTRLVLETEAQTARADALEALNATMHERISGLVAEIAQERDRSAKLLEALDSVDELVECERRMAISDNAPLEYEKRSASIYEAMRAATKRYPTT